MTQYPITWKELNEAGELVTRTETIEAASGAAALRFVECTYFWVTAPKVVKEPVGEEAK